MPDQPHLEEQLLSQAIAAGLASQLDEAETMSVDVHTDVTKAVQGKADAIAISGQGMAMGDIRVQELEVQTDRVAVNPLSILLGKLKLNHPIDATATLTLTEADINRAMNSPIVAERIPPLLLNVAGTIVPVELQLPLEVKLPATGRVALRGKALLFESEGPRHIEFEVVIVPRSDRQPARMEAFQCQPGQGLSLEFTIALMQKFQELLELPYLEIEGMAVRVKRLEVQPGQLTLETETYIPQIPSL